MNRAVITLTRQAVVSVGDLIAPDKHVVAINSNSITIKGSGSPFSTSLEAFAMRYGNLFDLDVNLTEVK